MTAIYFSGTGNTRFCTEYFLHTVNASAEAYSIENENALSAIADNDEIIFGYPVYYSNIPKIVNDFIVDNSELWNGKRIFVISTMALFSGDGSGVGARLLEKYGAEVIGGLHIEMPDCIGDVRVLKRNAVKNGRLIEKARLKISKSAENYKSGKYTRNGLGLLSRVSGFLIQRFWFMNKTKHYSNKLKINSADCIGCGKCARLCPMENIELADGKVLAGNKCTMCYRCVSRCPEKAITLIGRKIIEQYDIQNYIK